MKAMYEKRKTSYEEIMNKKLKNFFIIVQIVTITMPIGKGAILEPSRIYIMYGTDIHGRKTLIGIYIEEKENSRYWLEEIEKIKRRGLEKILYVSTERNKRLEQALKIVYNPIVKISINEEVERIAKYTQYRWKATGEQELVKAYLSDTEEEYAEIMKALKIKYKDNKIGSELLEKFEKETQKQIKEPKEIRHLICSYSTKRRLKQMIGNVTKEFEEVEDLKDLVEKRKEYFSTFEKTRIYSKERWTQMLNQIYETKYEEIKEYV